MVKETEEEDILQLPRGQRTGREETSSKRIKKKKKRTSASRGVKRGKKIRNEINVDENEAVG